MITRTFLTAFLVFGGLPFAEAGQSAKRLTEAQVWALSNAQYTQILSDAHDKGLDYTASQVASGYRRHHEEYRLRLIEKSYKIGAGEVTLWSGGRWRETVLQKRSQSRLVTQPSWVFAG